MSHYIVCQKKRNNPRMDIRICQEKCDLKEECPEYIAYTKALAQSQKVSSYAKPQPVALQAN
jgi:hypothetical protein